MCLDVRSPGAAEQHRGWLWRLKLEHAAERRPPPRTQRPAGRPGAAERPLDRALLHLLALKRSLEAPLAYRSRSRARLAEGADGAACPDGTFTLEFSGKQPAARAARRARQPASARSANDPTGRCGGGAGLMRPEA